MQTLMLEVQEEFVPNVLALLETLPKQSYKVNKKPSNTQEKSLDKAVLNDLSQFKPRNDLVVGDSDDLVNISWEHEAKYDLPR